MPVCLCDFTRYFCLSHFVLLLNLIIAVGKTLTCRKWTIFYLIQRKTDSVDVLLRAFDA